MNLDKLNPWLAFAANVGVLAGILFLAVEIQQANRIARASTEIDIRGAYGVLNEGLYSEETGVAALFMKASEPDALSDEERFRLRAWLTQMVNQWVSIEIAYENEMAPEETFGVVLNDQEYAIESWPAVRPIFRQIVDSYGAIGDMEVIRSLDQKLRERGF